MAAKRMRVFAGPNGSGKTTIFKGILSENKVQLGVYVNADEIEQVLRESKALPFSTFQLEVTSEQLKNFFARSNFSPVKRNEPDLWKKVDAIENEFTTTADIDSYLSADLAEFIRQQLLANAISFTYETVMSHSGKIDFLQEALQKGYRVYLYYIATEDPDINISRVSVRVAQDGHFVDPVVVRNRYYKSLNNLKAAVKQTNRAYIFDNSQKQANLVAEITNGTDVVLNTAVDMPNWVSEYLMNKAD
jgi:predicted ABC-type ATPase